VQFNRRNLIGGHSVCRVLGPCVVASILFALIGCRVGPEPRTPIAPLANHWKNYQTTESDGGATFDHWWSEFEDPLLDGLIQQAIAANPSLQEARYRVLEARARRGVVTGERFPEVKGSGDYSFKKVSGNSSPYALTSQDNYSLFSAGFDAAWELNLWGKLSQAVEAADAEIGVADGDYNFVLLTLLGDVAATYVELRTYQQRIVVANENVEVQQRTLQLAQARLRAGLTKPLDAVQAKYESFRNPSDNSLARNWPSTGGKPTLCAHGGHAQKSSRTARYVTIDSYRASGLCLWNAC